MSQAKVDKHKEEKRNRQQLMKKEKREWMMVKLGGLVLALAIVAWAGFSVYQMINAPEEGVHQEYTVNLDAITEYVNGLPES